MKRNMKVSDVSLVLSGRVATSPELVSRYGSTKVLCVDLETKRLSGAMDTFSVHFPNTLGVVLQEGMYIEVHGDIRSINDKESDRVVYPFIMASEVKELPGEPSEYKNEVEITNAELVNFDGVRASYTDSEKSLATYRVRVTRKHGRYSFFRVTTWGRDAIFLGNIYKSVKYMHLKCRLQSYVSKTSNRLRFALVSYYLEVPTTKKKAEEPKQENEADSDETV